MADAAIVERLETIWVANTDQILEKLNGLNRAIHGTAASIKKEMSATGLEAAVNKVFDSSRLAVLDAGASRLRVFGSALEPLGAAGLAAGAGIAAMAVGVEAARKAAEWAEDLERASKTIGVSTTALQEFDHVATASGVPVEEFRKSIEGLNEKIGLMQSGALGKNSKIGKVFQALLGENPAEQLRQMGDVQTILPAIADKLASLPSAEREGLASRLDIAPILPALIQGRDHLTDLISEAHRFGLVADEDLVRKAAEASEKMHVASEIINKQLTVAFANLSPFVADAGMRLAEMARHIAEVIKNAGDAIEPIAKLIEHLKQIPGVNLAFAAGNAAWGAEKWALKGGLWQYPLAALGSQGRADALHKGVEGLFDGSWSPSSDWTEAYGGPRPPKDLLGGDAGGRGRRGRAGPNPEDVIKASLAAVARATEDELRARQAIAGDLGARLVIEKTLLDAETKAKFDDLDIQVAKKQISRAAAEQAKILINAAAQEKAQKLQRDADYQIEDKQIEVHKAEVEAQIAALQDQLEMTKMSAQRAVIERRILDLRQQLERDLEGTTQDRGVQEGSITPSQRARTEAATAVKQDADQRKFLYDTYYGTVHDALSAAIHGGWPGLAKYMADKLESNIVDALANSLTHVLIGGGSGGGGLFGAMFGAVFGLPHFAGGTDSAPGGLALVGEAGPEIVNLPAGSRVIPNHALGSLGSISPGMASTIVINHFAPDLRGAVVTQDLLDQMNQIGHTAALQGATMGVQAARQMIPQEAARRASLQIR